LQAGGRPAGLGGCLLWEDAGSRPRRLIMLNAAEPESRRIFTGLHELVHFVRNDGDALFDGGEGVVSDPIFEREAFAGAREIALPLEEALAYRDRCRAEHVAMNHDVALGELARTSLARAIGRVRGALQAAEEALRNLEDSGATPSPAQAQATAGGEQG